MIVSIYLDQQRYHLWVEYHQKILSLRGKIFSFDALLANLENRCEISDSVQESKCACFDCLRIVQYFFRAPIDFEIVFIAPAHLSSGSGHFGC